MSTAHSVLVRRRGLVQRAVGFTLIELMIALAVIAILAAIAYPSYQDSIRKGRRSEAFTEIARIQQAQEKHRANNPNYSSNVGSAGLGLNSGGVSASYSTTYYTFTLSAASATTYTVEAVAVAGKSQANDTNCQCLRALWSGADATYWAGPSCGSVTEAQGSSCWRR